jgi:hypothetical protein
MTSKVNHTSLNIYNLPLFSSLACFSVAMDVPLASKAFPSPSYSKYDKSTVDDSKSSSKQADLNPNANVSGHPEIKRFLFIFSFEFHINISLRTSTKASLRQLLVYHNFRPFHCVPQDINRYDMKFFPTSYAIK